MSDTGWFNLIEYELDDYRENVRNGNIDPSYGYVPTITTVVDSLRQMPEDMIVDMLGGDARSDNPDEWMNVVVTLIEFLDYAVSHPEQLLVEIVEAQ